jgi:hypothetical protein
LYEIVNMYQKARRENKAHICIYTPFIINVHVLWKADFSLATLAKGPHLVLCFVMVANNVNAPTANRSAFFQNFIRLRSYHRI